MATPSFILAGNFNLVLVSWRYSGRPYLSAEHKKNVKTTLLVALYWSLAFVVKLTIVGITDDSKDNQQSDH